MEYGKPAGSGAANAGIAFSAVVLCYLLLNLIFSIICVAADVQSSSAAYVYISYLLSPAATAIALPVVLKKRKVSPRVVFPVKTSPVYYAAAVLLSFGLLFSVSWLNTGFLKLLQLCGYSGDGGAAIPETSGGLVVAVLLVIAVLPAFFEEGLFRGAMLGCMEEDCGTVNSVLICGFCFALYHANAVQTVYQFVCGCAFALLCVRARSVLPCMLAHLLNNGTIIVLEACGLDTSGSIFDWAPQWAAVLVTVLSALSFAACALFLILNKKPLKKPVKGGVKYFFITAVAGIAALAIIWIVSLF